MNPRRSTQRCHKLGEQRDAAEAEARREVENPQRIERCPQTRRANNEHGIQELRYSEENTRFDLNHDNYLQGSFFPWKDLEAFGAHDGDMFPLAKYQQRIFPNSIKFYRTVDISRLNPSITDDPEAFANMVVHYDKHKVAHLKLSQTNQAQVSIRTNISKGEHFKEHSRLLSFSQKTETHLLS